MFKQWILLLFFFPALVLAQVELGVDLFFKEKIYLELKGKRIGLITNHTGINAQMRSTIDLFLDHSKELKLAALFAPEHGLFGDQLAAEEVKELKGPRGIPIYSLHGKTRRPTSKMLQGIDVLIFDIQDIGCRSYTYTTTLFYAMEEAAKRKIPVIVFDRPNPINGLLVDGPMLESQWRSFLGYVNVPYCHGMTIGELARFFNQESGIGCDLRVVAMRGWKRSMSFKETGLAWVPTSPYIPESDTPLYYASTGLIGELGLVSIGIGYTLPFKIIGAPWIKGEEFAKQLNDQNLPGVRFHPFRFRPFYGIHKGRDCQGIIIHITSHRLYRPLAVQYMLLGVLKSLYPKQMQTKLAAVTPQKRELFCKANGNEAMWTTLLREKYVAWKLILYQKEEREEFRAKRQKYLLY